MHQCASAVMKTYTIKSTP